MARRTKVYVELEGQEDMRRAFARLEFAALAHVKEQIQESAQVIEREAKARLVDQTDVESAKTVESIKIIYYDAGMSASIGSGYFNARFKEQGTQHEPARPFLNPAFQQERPKYLQGVEDALNDAGREASVE
jgi:HK97 gp10 family phage protein